MKRLTVLLLIGFLVTAAIFAQRTILIWNLWSITHSAGHLAVFAAAYTLPIVLFSPFAGSVADRADGRGLLTYTNCANAVPILALAVCIMLDADSAPVYHVFSLMIGLSNSILFAALNSQIRKLAAPPALSRAVSLYATVINLATVVGPICAGVLITQTSPLSGLMISTLIMLAPTPAVALLGPLPPTDRHEQAQAHTFGTIWSDTIVGVKYAFTTRFIGIYLASVGLASVFGRSIQNLFQPFNDAMLDGGAATLAYLSASHSLGAAIGGMSVGQVTSPRALKIVFFTNLAGAGLLLGAMSIKMRIEAALILVFLLGIFFGLNSVSCQVYILKHSDPEYSGRMLGLYTMIFRGSLGLGSLMLGGLISVAGLRYALCVFSFALTVAGILIASRRKILSNDFD
jgi:MFS family permease